MKDKDYFDEILVIIEEMDTTVSDKPTPMMFGVNVKDLLGGKMKQTIEQMTKREHELMKMIAEEYYQARLLEFSGTQFNTYDFGTSIARYTTFEFIIRHDDPLHPTIQYKVEKTIRELGELLGYKVRLEKK